MTATMLFYFWLGRETEEFAIIIRDGVVVWRYLPLRD
jgi:hypothetical protein